MFYIWYSTIQVIGEFKFMQISNAGISPNFNGYLHLVSSNETTNDKNLAVVINTDEVSSFDGIKGGVITGAEYLTNVHMKNGDIINVRYPLTEVLKAYNSAKTKGIETLYTPDDQPNSQCARYIRKNIYKNL